MKAVRHKWLCIYYAPNGQAYYRYGATKTEVKEWFGDREGTAEFFKLTYTKAGTKSNSLSPYRRTYDCSHDNDSIFQNESGAW